MIVEVVCRILSWDDITEGQVAEWKFSIDEAAMSDFARLSGDINPVHCNDSFAQSKGYDGRIVYGALLTAQLSRLVGMEIPGRDAVFIGFTANFRRPVYVGDEVIVHAKVVQKSGAGAVSMKYTMCTHGKVSVVGTADAMLKVN